jgi:hypothetical protein
VAYPVDFRGGPWDGKREEWTRLRPPEVIEVPGDQGVPFLYRLVAQIDSHKAGGTIHCIYEPDPSMAPDESHRLKKGGEGGGVRRHARAGLEPGGLGWTRTGSMAATLNARRDRGTSSVWAIPHPQVDPASRKR